MRMLRMDTNWLNEILCIKTQIISIISIVLIIILVSSIEG
jgi:hypothetical protein